MHAEGCLYVPPGSPALRFAQGLSWLWRLGELSSEPDSGLVGLGWAEESGDLYSLVQRGDLAGAVIFADRPGSDVGPLPGRARRRGVADFGDGDAVQGQFACLTEGEPALRSSLGVHTTREERWMVVGADPSAVWGALDGFWILPALADFLVEILERPLVMLPPVGWARYDDVPGNGYQQLMKRDKPDREWKDRIDRLASAFGEAGAVLNMAVTARGYVDQREVNIEEIWPEAVASLAKGIEAGAFEPLCHGYLHVDTTALDAGRIEPREFGQMPLEEAERKLAFALEWMPKTLGAEPSSFIAPTWAYSDGIREALAQRGLAAWLGPQPGPLLQDGNVRESMISTLEGLYRLNYGPLRRFAEAGYPPTVVIHGGLFDGRFQGISLPRDAVTYAQLYLKRDLFRVPWVEGVRWVGAGELIAHFRRHDQIEVSGSEIVAPEGTVAVVRDRSGSRPLAA
jgi:hypothetical protein